MLQINSHPEHHHQIFEEAVGNRYHIYNSLFLKLPFQGITRTGTLLPLLLQRCDEGFKAGKTPDIIIDDFFRDFGGSLNDEEKTSLMFDFVRYVERQVVLFDSVEDAAFAEVQDLKGTGTVNALLLRAQAEGREQQLREKLEQFSVRIVLTAHPTQFYPGAVLSILTDLEQAIRVNDLYQINLLLHQLGKTRFFKKAKPTPFEEAVSLSWYLENVFYHSVSEIIEKLCTGLSVNMEDWKNHRLFSVGFWPGGDRDGNPFVTSDTTLKVATHLRDRVIRSFFNEVKMLKRRLTFPGVDEIIQKIETRLIANIQNRPEGYSRPEDLLEDLNQAQALLYRDHDGLFAELTARLVLKVRVFGFHFAGIEIRQHADRHAAVWRSLTGEKFDGMSDDEKISNILSAEIPEAPGDAQISEDIAAFRVIRQIQEMSGEQACNRYIISNCGSAADVISVFSLARKFSSVVTGDIKNNLQLDIIPLFESIEDLANAHRVMDALFRISAYRSHVTSRGNRQVIMLGFSDGTKDGGYLRANWSIFRAKEELTEVCRQHDITAVFFDGRGGPPARGGGNTHDFYASLGPTIESREIEITIQGQTISSNFGRNNSCTYNLEQLLSAGIEQSVFGSRQPFTEEQKQVMEDLATAAYETYLDLKLDSDFVPYLEEVTPLPFFGETNIGSRPVKRSKEAKLRLEDLRAIPFVGSWAQMKQNIPGFYGVGSALKKFSDDKRQAQLQELFKQSLFFRTLLGNSMMSLTKTYYPATSHLKKDPRFGRIWNKMFSEFEISRNMLLEVSGMSHLMAGSPAGRQSIRMREQIVLPLIAIQQYALMHVRNRREEPAAEPFRKLVIRTMFGIVNAARNSA
jgi:phosphoenolpyruvate carboxylase